MDSEKMKEGENVGSKKIVILLLITCLLLLASSSMAMAAVETRRVLSFTEEGLKVRAYAPYQAYPGDTIEVRVTAEASEALDDIYLTIDIFGSKPKEGKEGYDGWEDDISVLRGVDWDEGDDKDQEYEVEIPEDSDPGLVYGHVTAEWTTADGEPHTYAESFTITYLMNKDYEDLQEDYEDLSSEYGKLKTDFDDLSSTYSGLLATYNSLKSDYDSLKATYDSLKSSYDSLKSEHDTLVSDYSTLQKKYTSLDSDYNSLLADYDALESEYEMSVGDLGTSRNLMYVFVVTTIVFVATSIILFLRKPKTA